MNAFIAGVNFSGRSAALMARLRESGPAFLVGPYAEAALSGLSSTVADEIAIYSAPGETGRGTFAPLDFAACATRKPPTLSGGEQVLLALHCFSRSSYRTIGIDTALEQLDPENRADALAYLSRGEGFATLLIDNRLACPDGWSHQELTGTTAAFPCDLAAATADLGPRGAPTIAIKGLSFRYPGGREIFRNVDLMLEPGRAYRLTGRNGAGKTTLFRLLAGVLAPASGAIALDRAPYAPWRSGNRVFALAAQNPDHQWCGATPGEDLARRRRALARYRELAVPADAIVATLAARLGVPSLDQHLYELPLVARKRASWLWALTGALPWIMLDEPSVGQDRTTRAALAAAINRLAALGYGVVFITHDDEFAAGVRHQALLLANRTVAARRQA
jgi:energy-coupling factor transporter ATP-binding protein EcfA2